MKDEGFRYLCTLQSPVITCLLVLYLCHSDVLLHAGSMASDASVECQQTCGVNERPDLHNTPHELPVSV